MSPPVSDPEAALLSPDGARLSDLAGTRRRSWSVAPQRVDRVAVVVGLRFGDRLFGIRQGV